MHSTLSHPVSGSATGNSSTQSAANSVAVTTGTSSHLKALHSCMCDSCPSQFCTLHVTLNHSATLFVQASQLEALRAQLQQELATAKQRLQELRAAQDGLLAQVGLPWATRVAVGWRFCTGQRHCAMLAQCCQELAWWMSGVFGTSTSCCMRPTLCACTSNNCRSLVHVRSATRLQIRMLLWPAPHTS